MILSDNETKIDLLNSESIAQTIVKLIRERPDTPISIGVHGDWGAGKSSVLEMIENILSTDKKVVCIKFNGWRFQGFEDSKIALLESIVSELVEKRSLLTKASDEVKDIWDRIDLLKVAKKAGGLLLTAATGVPTPEVVNSIIAGVTNIVSNPKKFATKENLDALSEGATSLLKPKSESKNIPQEIKDFRKAFDKLLAKADVDQLIVLVDDLDRCLPDTAIETLEAIRLFVFTSKTAFVIAADEAMIEYAVRKHFPDLPEESGYQAYTRNYLEKLIQVPFRIPILGEFETKMYVSLLFIASSIGEDADGFNKLIAAARERLKKPWESKNLDVKIIDETLGSNAKDGRNALLISEQIGPILASGAKGNPRQIKRFLNTLILRQLTAEARGFGSSIALPALAKLMIAERFLPRLFEQIATLSANSSDGKSQAIKMLEQELTGEEKVKGSKAKSVDITTENQKVLTEWLSTDDIKLWGKIQPPLADIDLRPYIFVAKDKKDFFNISSSLGNLTSITETLMGSKLIAQSVSEDLKKLGNADSNKIFDTLKSRILVSDLQREPNGINGMNVLVKAFPHLQGDVMDFLESLPIERIGMWVVKGWENIIVEPEQKNRLSKLISAWAVNTKNSQLKAVASNVLKAKK